MFLNRDKYNQNAQIKTLKLNLNPRINNTNKAVRKKITFFTNIKIEYYSTEFFQYWKWYAKKNYN